MKAEVLVVGDELLCGRRADLNGPFLLTALARAGAGVSRCVILPDSVGIISEEIQRILTRPVDVVILSGGLGATTDDKTREGVAQALGLELAMEKQALAMVEEKIRIRGGGVPVILQRMAARIPGSTLLPNAVGIAPGQSITHGPTTFFLLPGPPAELKEMFLHHVAPKLGAGNVQEVPRFLTFRTAGVKESELAARIEPLVGEKSRIRLSFLPGNGMVDLYVTAEAGSEQELNRLSERIKHALFKDLYAEEEISLQEVVGRGLAKSGGSLAVAESCTGGWLAKLISDVPGSSEYFLGGVVAYDNRIKQTRLLVPEELLAAHGAVSREVAQAMARGVRHAMGSDWAISITGIAGPGGGSREKPVGLVYVGLASPDGSLHVSKHMLGGDRATVRLTGATLALDLLRRALRKGGSR